MDARSSPQPIGPLKLPRSRMRRAGMAQQAARAREGLSRVRESHAREDHGPNHEGNPEEYLGNGPQPLDPDDRLPAT